MDQFTRPASIALSFGLPALLASGISFGQQPGAPQAYPQTPYSQQGALSQPATASPYPVTQQTSQPQSTDFQPPAGQVQPAAVPPANAPPQAPVAPQVPKGFDLNALQQAELDAVLTTWQTESAKINTFTCSFDRWEYVMAFGPVIDGQPAPLNKDTGELTYSKPDKGSFQITAISTYKKLPPPADQPNAPVRGDWIPQPKTIGEHWVCDGKSVYEYRNDQKQVIERPIPPEMQGQAIVDGPLPFLFGADANKLKQRYWMKVDNQNQDPNKIWLIAMPKFQEQAANFSQVDLILDRKLELPQAMRVTMPNRDQHVYMFNLKTAQANAVFDRLQQALFQKPSIPFGYKHVLEQTPVAESEQAAKPRAR
jgi:TIGR03009 family protein